MIETMVNFRPRELWPRRVMTDRDATRQAGRVLDALVRGRPDPPVLGSSRLDLGLRGRRPAEVRRPDARVCLPPQRRVPPRARAGAGVGLARRARRPPSWPSGEATSGRSTRSWSARAPSVFDRLAIEDLLTRLGSTDPEVASALAAGPPPSRELARALSAGREPITTSMGRPAESPDLPPIPADRVDPGGALGGLRPRPGPLAEGASRPGRVPGPSSTGRSRCRDGRTSGRCRSRTAWTCSRPA